MDLIDKKRNAKVIIRRLIKKYGNDIPIFLHYHKNKPYEFLFAVMLSAQCTDERVNIVTKALYNKYNTLEKIANAKLAQLEKDIHSVGFYHNKTKNIINTAKILLEKYNGKIPDSIIELIKLPGVGRKTANVVLGNIYNIPSMAVDTHVKRISTKLFLLDKKLDAKKVEEELIKIIPKKYYVLWNTHIISFGREVCKARNPLCDICMLCDVCLAKNR